MLGCGGLLRFSDREFREQFPKAYHVGRYVAAGDDEGDGQNDHRYAAADSRRQRFAEDGDSEKDGRDGFQRPENGCRGRSDVLNGAGRT